MDLTHTFLLPDSWNLNSNPVLLPKLYMSKGRRALEVDKSCIFKEIIHLK